jgi:hypothetical protein
MSPNAPLKWLLAATLLLSSFSGVAEEGVSAEYGVAAGRDIRDSEITIGLSPEQVQELALAIFRDEKAKYEDQLEELSHQLHVTREAVVSFLKILNQQAVPLEKLPETLAEIAQRHQETLARLAALDPEDPTIKALTDEARAAMEAGDYDRADVQLHQAEVAELAAARQAEILAEQAHAAAEKRWLNAAAVRAERGELSLTQLNYSEAAAHFKAASERVPESQPQVKGAYLRRHADALSGYGNRKGDNAALRQAIAIYPEVFGFFTREQAPLEWARTLHYLGDALRILGAREAGTERLAQAVNAYQQALKERTRERVPLDWARTQVGLGIALRSLGEREADTERLEQAVDAYQQALKELTRERVPLDWATTQLGLGNALASLGERKKERAYFNQAKTAFQSAHAVWKEAGYSQYDGYFEETLRRLDQRMAQY